MNKGEIIEAIADDKMMPFIQPDQLAKIVNFVIKNYEPSLPSDLDEAAHSYAWEKQEHHIDFDGDEYFDYGPRYDAFKAGAEWMAGQGETHEHYVIREIADHDIGPAIVAYPETFEIGDKVVVQIRKKQ